METRKKTLKKEQKPPKYGKKRYKVGQETENAVKFSKTRKENLNLTVLPIMTNSGGKTHDSEFGKYRMEINDRCVVCGAYVHEGMMVCISCQQESVKPKKQDETKHKSSTQTPVGFVSDVVLKLAKSIIRKGA